MKQEKATTKAGIELGKTLIETSELASGVREALDEVERLRDHGYGGAGDGMIKFGAALVMFPEPFLVTDVVGAGIIGAGILYNHAVPPPLYIDDVAETITSQLAEINDASAEIGEMRLKKPGS